MVSQIFSILPLVWKVKVYHHDTPHLYALITDETLHTLCQLNGGTLRSGWCYSMAQVDITNPPTMTVTDFLASYAGAD